MAHPNDTLQGRLLAFEREDEKHLRHSFGYWRMVEKRMIRDQIKAEGGDPNNEFEVSRRVTENHKNDPTLREQQEAARAARGPVTPSESIGFSREELEYLVDHFDMTNHPTGEAVRRHAWAALVRMEMRGE